MSDLERYIDSLPLDPMPERLLRYLITNRDRLVTRTEMMNVLGYSRKYTKPMLRAIVETGAAACYKPPKPGEPVYFLSDPRLLRYVGMDKPLDPTARDEKVSLVPH